MAQPAAVPFDNGSTTTNASSYATTSKAFVAGRLYLLIAVATKLSAVTDPTVSNTTGGIAWTLVKSKAGVTNDSATAWCWVPGSNLTTTVTINYGAQAITGQDWEIIEVTNFDSSGTALAAFRQIGAGSTGTSAAPSDALTNPPRTNSLTVGFAFQEANAAFTAGSGFSKLNETVGHITPPTRAAIEADTGTAKQTMNWTITSAAWCALSFEITSSDVNVSPTVVASVASVAASTVRGDSAVVPSVVAAAASVAAPTVAAAASPTPAVVSGLASVPAPTVRGDGAVSPSAVAAVASAASPTLRADSGAAPSVVAAVVSAAAPTVAAAAIPTPAVVAGVASVAAPSIEADGAVAPSMVLARAQVSTPSVEADSAVSPAMVLARVQVSAPALAGDSEVSPGMVLARAQVSTPSVEADSNVAPDMVLARAQVSSPTLAGDSEVSPAMVLARVQIPSPTLSSDTEVSPDMVLARAQVVTPAVHGDATVSPARVLVFVTIPQPQFGIVVIIGPIARGHTSSPPRGLGLVRWQAISPEGEAMILRLGEAESFETAAGGYKSAHGFVAGGLVDRYSRILADGSLLRSIFVPTEEVLWGGRLLDPAPEGGKANITAEGYGLDAGRIFERLLWKNPNPGDWSEQGAAPALVPADDDKISVSIGDGEIKLTVSDGTVFDGGEGNGAVFAAFPEGVSRLTFTVKKKSTTDKYVVRVHGGPGPEYDPATWVKFGDDIVLTDSGPSLVDVAIDGDVGLIAIDLSRYVVEPTTGATSYWVKVTDLVVYGRTAEDEYSGSSMMRDLYGMLGISALGVTELGGNALPRDVRASSAEQVANDLAVLMDARWGIYDTGSKEYGTFGAWGETTWIAPTTRGIHPLPLRRYDSVGCPYQTSNPKVNGLAVVAAPYKLKTSRMFTVEISGDLPTEDVAIAICTTLAPFLVEPRFVLDATLTKLIDQAGCEWSAHRARCGHSLIVPGFDMPFRLWTLRRTDRAVQVTSPDSQDRINATVAQALARAA